MYVAIKTSMKTQAFISAKYRNTEATIQTRTRYIC